MSRDELIARFSLDRVGESPATFDYAKLDWMNGVYLRELSPEEYAATLVTYLREQGLDWDEDRIRASAPLVQEKISRLGEFPGYAGFLFHDVEPDPGLLDPAILRAAAEDLEQVEPWTAEQLELALKVLSDRLGLKPRQAFQPIRVAVTGSNVSPGLYESLELLGRDEPRRRGSGLTGASGSRARWNSSHARRRKLSDGRGRRSSSPRASRRAPAL